MLAGPLPSRLPNSGSSSRVGCAPSLPPASRRDRPAAMPAIPSSMSSGPSTSLAPLAYQGVASLRQGAVYRARHREHLPALLGGGAGGDAGARPPRRLHNQHPGGHAADDAVTPREHPLVQLHARGTLRNQRALLGNAARQLFVQPRIDPIQSRGADAHCASPAFQGRLVGSRVDALGQTAGDAQAAAAERAGKVRRRWTVPAASPSGFRRSRSAVPKVFPPVPTQTAPPADRRFRATTADSEYRQAGSGGPCRRPANQGSGRSRRNPAASASLGFPC